MMHSEPWRYRCPECGSVNLRRRGDGSATPRDPAGRFYCRQCKTGHKRRYDAKNEVLVS